MEAIESSQKKLAGEEVSDDGETGCDFGDAGRELFTAVVVAKPKAIIFGGEPPLAGDSARFLACSASSSHDLTSRSSHSLLLSEAATFLKANEGDIGSERNA